MKRISGKRLLNNNWVVPASVLILTLCIGSFALAATGSSSSDPYSFLPPTMTSATLATTATTQVRPAPTSSTASPFLGYQTVATTAPADAIAAAELALEQAKENAILDLIGEKMTPEDKVVFVQLRAVAAEQRLAVTRAQAEACRPPRHDRRPHRQVPGDAGRAERVYGRHYQLDRASLGAHLRVAAAAPAILRRPPDPVPVAPSVARASGVNGFSRKLTPRPAARHGRWRCGCSPTCRGPADRAGRSRTRRARSLPCIAPGKHDVGEKEIDGQLALLEGGHGLVGRAEGDHLVAAPRPARARSGCAETTRPPPP